MSIQKIKEVITDCSARSLHLYFIVRSLKSSVKRSTKTLDKYDYSLYQVDVDSEIQDYLHALTSNEIERLIKKKTEVSEYDVINDDSEQILTYGQ